MVRIPHIKIPSVRVGGIDPTSDIGTAIGGVQPTPITYLTNWKIVGNSEVHGNEIWSCGEYSVVDGKWHILVQPLGGSIADIALNEPLRKVNNVADIIEFPSNTEGKALVIRNLGSEGNLGQSNWGVSVSGTAVRYTTNKPLAWKTPIANIANILCALYETKTPYHVSLGIEGIALSGSTLSIHDDNYNATDAETRAAFKAHIEGVEVIYELATPTTELVDAPQIQEAESYSCVISQGAKAVSWSSFETESNS